MKKTIWVLLDNRMGSVGQAKGIIQELSSERFDIIEKKLEYNKLSGLPNWIRRASLIGIKNKKEIKGEIPELLISTSRRTAPVALYLKKKYPQIQIVQLMHPGNYGIQKFARVFLPQHDSNKNKLPNFYYTVGSPHKVNQNKLFEAKNIWEDKFADLPRPLTAVIIGGSIKGKPFSLANAKQLAEEIKQLKSKIGGSLLITDSRRTGGEAENLIINILKDIPQHTYLWGSKQDNPLMGYYACADNIVVTGDSVSMCCEACGTGKPVFIFKGHEWLTDKHQRFVQSLFDSGYATLLQNGCEQFSGGKILYPSIDIAQEITHLLD